MKNKAITLSDLRKIISENAYRILQEEDEEGLDNGDLDLTPEPENIGNIDDSTPIDNGIENEPYDETKDSNVPKQEVSYANLSNIIENLVSTINNDKKIQKLNDAIKKALTTGRIDKGTTFEKMVVQGVDKAEFEYFLTVLATLYKSNKTSANEKKNIREAIFLSLPVYNMSSSERSEGGDVRSSSLSNLVSRKAGIGSFLGMGKTIDSSYYFDIIADSIYDAIDYAIENYSPLKGTFFPLFLTKAANNAKDRLSSKLHKKTFAAGGEKTSIDEPLGSSEDERDETKADRMTGKEGEISKEQKDAAKEVVGALKSFVQEKLGQKSTLKNYLEFFNLFSKGNSLSEIADIMEVTSGNLRVIKKRMEDFITKFVESGEFQEYVANETGMKVEFPNNKFSLSTQGSKKGTAEVEPVEYFQVTGNNPETGDPVGEWVELTPDTHDSETTWFDNYGSLVNWRDKEEGVESASNIEANVTDENPEEENQIAESLIKIIQKVIAK